ncbi:MAG: transposase [Nitrospirales bacterium]|nr:transposase [Nitrospirales bacterium]
MPQIITEPVVRIEERSPLEREALGTDKNPIPVLWRAHPRGSPGRMVQLFKRMTARAVFRGRPGSKQELWGGEFWSEESSVATVEDRANGKMGEYDVQPQGYPKENLRPLNRFSLFDTPSACCGVLH